MKHNTICLALCASFLIGGCATLKDPTNGTRAEVDSTAKNVILFVGDGMGVSTVTAIRIFDGQSQGKTGEEHVLPFEKFPHVGLVKTYNVNQQVPDSAGTATAMTTGVKTNAGFINIGPASERANCRESQSAQLESLGAIAHRKGKTVGIVSTARLTHATPAAMYAHSPERDWESDADMPASERRAGCADIATQLLQFPFDIALGGGAQNFSGKSAGGKRLLAQERLTDDWAAADNKQYIKTREELKRADASKQVLGLFSKSHMTFMADKPLTSTEPTLTEMTEAAIAHMENKKNGYVLMVEGGRIDHGHHNGRAGYALTEGREFARAVDYAVKNTDPSETLILVTADHSHVFTMAGYPTRGNDILGLVVGNDGKGNKEISPKLATDGLPYTTLGYWNGPGAIKGARTYPETGITAIQQAAIPTGSGFDKTAKHSETHGGEDVAIYAAGPGSESVHGVMEQNKVFEVIIGAFGW